MASSTRNFRIDRRHRDAANVELLSPEPVRAFSSLSAFVGFSLIAIVTFSATTDPAGTGGTLELALSGSLIALGLGCFILPLWGMHRRLQAERARLLAQVGARLEATLERLYRHVDTDEKGATDVRDRMLALVAARDMIAGQSTWPWSPGTLPWLLSALLIPIALWGVTRALEMALPALQ